MPRLCSRCGYLDVPTSQCRRYAATGATISADRLANLKPWLACWPIVKDDDWCGEFVARGQLEQIPERTLSNA